MSYSQDEQLLKMAEQIAANVGARLAPLNAAAKTVDHINRFWTVEMKERLIVKIQSENDNASETLAIVANSLGKLS